MNNLASVASAQAVAVSAGRKFFMTTIYDHVGKAYHCPAFVPNTALAVRAFANAANDKTHPVGMNPGDYTMFVIGEWDEDTAEFKIYPTQQSLGLGASYVKQGELDVRR